MLIAQKDIPRLHITACSMLKHARSIHSILEQVQKAADGVYSARSYGEDDFEQQFLFLSLGGRAVAELAHKTQGKPSVAWTRRWKQHQIHLVCSAGFPTPSTIAHNLDSAPQFLPSFVSPPPISIPGSNSQILAPIHGLQLVIDEISTEQRIRWDSHTNNLLGFCREHTKDSVMEFHSIMQARDLADELRDKVVHFASEVSVTLRRRFGSVTET